jgi:hypothetical protein
MPAGSTASYSDAVPANSPTDVSVPLVPGSYITFSDVSGGVGHGPNLALDGAKGNASKILTHGADSPGGATPAEENGIADIVSPIDAILGVFLTANAPDSEGSAPPRRDYSSAASRDNTTYDDIQTRQPFFIGNGLTNVGTTQQFKVPAGATRLFLGTMDGHEWANNLGQFTITIHVPGSISLVK